MSEAKAVRTFMMIDGVEGASTYQHEVGSVELLGWSHSFVQPTQLARSAGTSGSAGKAKHENFLVTKQVDKTTRDLIKKCWEGGQILNVRIASYNADVKYLEITMDKVIVAKQEIGDDPSGVVPIENLELNYGKVKYSYTPVDESGAGQGEIPVEHDLETGVIA